MPARADRVLFPASGFTLDDALAYYRRASKHLVPHLKNRPLSFKRYPSSVNGESFWEKDAPSFTPEWVRRFPVPRRGGEGSIDYVVVNDAKTLLWVVAAGGIELHPFLHRIPRIDRPTQMVFDLDPGGGASIVECCRVAILLRNALDAVGLESFAKVSGSKGLQLLVPLNTPVTHAAIEAFAKTVAEETAKRHPKLAVAKMAKQYRAGKVFIDWSQNADFKTTVAVYSLRTKSDAPFVAMPVTWKEVERADAGALRFEPAAALKRLERRGDLFAGVLTRKQKLPLVIDAAPSPRATTGEPRPAVVNGVTLPKPGSQSGRRLFVLTTTESGNELWLDMLGKFKRWLLRPDREGGPILIAMPAGQFAVDPAYYRGEVPAEWRRRVKIEDIGVYEVVEGSYQLERFSLWFTGATLRGAWELEKVQPGREHRSWRLAPA